MNLEFYRNFIAMVEAGGMNKAAREIHVAQPALTRQLKVMEKEYGTPLVKPRKGRHRLELTEAGWIFYRQAKHILEADSSMRDEISRLTGGYSGTLAISVVPSLSAELISRAIKPFHETYRDMTFRIRESYHMEIVDEVRKGISEIGITNAPLPDPSLFEVLWQEEQSLALALPEGHELSHKEISLEMLSSLPLAVSRSTEEVVKQYFQKEGVSLSVVASVDTKASALLWAKEGMGLSLVMWKPGTSAEGLVFRKLSLPRFPLMATCFSLKNHALSNGMIHFLSYWKRGTYDEK